MLHNAPHSSPYPVKPQHLEVTAWTNVLQWSYQSPKWRYEAAIFQINVPLNLRCPLQNSQMLHMSALQTLWICKTRFYNLHVMPSYVIGPLECSTACIKINSYRHLVMHTKCPGQLDTNGVHSMHHDVDLHLIQNVPTPSSDMSATYFKYGCQAEQYFICKELHNVPIKCCLMCTYISVNRILLQMWQHPPYLWRWNVIIYQWLQSSICATTMSAPSSISALQCKKFQRSFS